MSMRTKVIPGVLMTALLMVGFQNCSPNNFSGSNQDGVGSLASEDDQEMVNTTVIKGSLVPIETSNDEASSQKASADNSNDNLAADEVDGTIPVASAQLGVCILQGSGRSQKLGYVEGTIAGGTSSAQAICMTAHACLDIAGQYFDAQMIHSRGFCKTAGVHGPETGKVILSDGNMESLLAAQFKKIN